MSFFKLMQGEFEISMMGELKYFLGLQIKQYKDEILIHQEKYVSTPMHPFQVLEADEEGDKVSDKLYRGMIGFLLYLTASRPNIQ